MKILLVFLTGVLFTTIIKAQTPEENLKKSGITLPVPAIPVANYLNWVRTGNFIYLSGKGPTNPDFTDQPKVVNGFSDLMVEIFGENGKHARSAVGMNSLPFGIPVEVEMIVEVLPD
jgi:enamine deaminase RidA (YjgF/YER057c/UK114 family)